MRPDTPPDESNVLDKVETALKQAVRQSSDLEWRYGTRVKRQKYVYLAVRHFTPAEEDLPVTYSWYKFGAYLAAAPETGTIGPVSTTMPTTRARRSTLYTTSFDDLTAFFTDELTTVPLDEEHWFASDLDFLEAFYTHHAPDEYQNLYLANVELRQRLRAARDALDDQIDTFDSVSKSHASVEEVLPDDLFGLGPSSDDAIEEATSGDGVLGRTDYEDIGRVAARMHLALVRADGLGDTLTEVRRFTNLVEDAFLALTHAPATDVTPAHLHAVETLEEVYSEWVWEYPALLMSKETATGPNASVLRKWSAQKHFSVEDNLSSEIDRVADRCETAGLVPSSSQYPSHDDELEMVAKETALSAMRRHE